MRGSASPIRSAKKRATSAKKTKRPLPGDLFRRLASERAKFVAQAERIARLDPMNADKLAEAFRNLRSALLHHWEAVQYSLHPVLFEEESSKIHDEVIEERQYEDMASSLANELSGISPIDPRWRPKFIAFSSLLRLYCEKSEKFLKHWRTKFNREDICRLGTLFDARSGEILTEATPSIH